MNFRYRKVGYVALNVTDVARTTVKIAGLADNIRGYGYVQEANVKQYEQDLAKLLASLNSVQSAPAKAA